MAQNESKKKKIGSINSEDQTKKILKSSSAMKSGSDTLLYGKDFYIWMLAGLGLITLGFVLMVGGNQAPNEWNANEIYSFRRTGLAPIVILLGLIVEIYAIFKK